MNRTPTSRRDEDRVAALAGGLRLLGVEAGDVVCWQRANNLDSALLFEAVWTLGAVAAPLHSRFGQAEIASLTRRLDPAVVLGADEVLPVGPPIAPGVWAGTAVILFTSGSTGKPKGVRLSHHALTTKAEQMVGVHGLYADDVVLMPAPHAHVSGLLNGILVPGQAGMATVWMDRWDPEQAVNLISTERVTFMVGPPTFFLDLIEAGLSADSSLRLISSGGAGITPEFCKETSARLGTVVKRSYGSTEAPTVAATPAAYHDRSDRCWHTDGQALADFRLADDGELLVRGPELFDGYLDPVENEGALVDGWFQTGDLGRLDEDPEGGSPWLHIIGRKKDVIIRGGENIAPAEVAAVLEGHPDIRQAVVIGVPDDRLGERVAAIVETDTELNVDQIARWFVDRGVAKYKAPEVLRCVPRLPTLASGKPDAAALRILLG